VFLIRPPGVYRAGGDTTLLIDGLHEGGGVAGRRVLDIGPGTPASGPSVHCTDPALARPLSPPMVQPIFGRRRGVPNAFTGLSQAMPVVGATGGLRAKVYIWFEH
jgi:hypothetical protein